MGGHSGPLFEETRKKGKIFSAFSTFFN